MDKSTTKTYIEYDWSLLQYARDNRKNMTNSETIIWNMILRKKQTWYTFLRQKILWPFIVDFYCSKLLLAIEVDWQSHEGRYIYDSNRIDYLNSLWIYVVRFSN